MRTAAAALAFVILGNSLNPSPANAHTGLRWGINRPPASQIVGEACVSTTTVWLQELGRNGVTRLRAKFERRAYYDPGIPGTSYSTTGWVHSASFPDDARNFWSYFSATFRFFPGGRYNIRARFIGERPSFWRPDYRLNVIVGEIGCDPLDPGFAPGEA